MSHLKPWALAPFELLEHAEMHLKGNSDFDKRMALVSFDNSIESSISTYLLLNPTQRNGQQFQKTDVEKWLFNYHSKIEFIEHFVLQVLKKQMEVERDDIVFYHGLRNELYHKGNGFVPAEIHVQGIRKAAFWVFSILFNIQDVNRILLQKSNDSFSSKQYEASSVSPENAFLEIFSNFKKEFNDLLETKSKISNDEIKSSVTEVLREIAQSNPNILPNQTISLLEKAGEIRNTIIQGKTIDETPLELKNINSQLAQLGEKINSSLRAYQKQVVDAAIQATTNAIDNKNNKIGIVLQPVGSGLGISLLSFILTIKTNPATKHLPILVLCDRSETREQLYYTLVKTLGDDADLAIIATDRISLISSLSLKQPKIIFTTIQLTRLGNQTILTDKECLVVGYSVQPPNEFERMTPKAFFITFTSALPANRNAFGNIIANYEFNQAVQDGFLLPIKVERRFLKNISDLHKGQLTSKEFCLLAQDILSHFELRQKQCSGKGFIIVPSIEFGNQLYQEFLQLGSKKISIENINSSISPEIRSVLYKRFNDENDNLFLIITTGSGLMGIDFPLLNVAYITNSVSEQNILQIISRICRPYKNKENALVIDYVGVDWKKFDTRFSIAL